LQIKNITTETAPEESPGFGGTFAKIFVRSLLNLKFDKAARAFYVDDERRYPDPAGFK
jgi:hypothetical protein